MSKKIIIIAGPNGAGKTTFARSFLPEEAQCPRFINADLIAAGLSPFPEDVIRRRLVAGLRNFDAAYKPVVDAWAKYNNVGESPVLLEWGENQ